MCSTHFPERHVKVIGGEILGWNWIWRILWTLPWTETRVFYKKVVENKETWEKDADDFMIANDFVKWMWRFKIITEVTQGHKWKKLQVSAYLCIVSPHCFYPVLWLPLVILPCPTVNLTDRLGVLGHWGQMAGDLEVSDHRDGGSCVFPCSSLHPVSPPPLTNTCFPVLWGFQME